MAKPSSPDCLLQAMRQLSEMLRCAHLRPGLPIIHGKGEDTPALLLLSQQPLCRMDASECEQGLTQAPLCEKFTPRNMRPNLSIN